MTTAQMPSNSTKIILLKTDIHSTALVAEISPVFNNHVAIRQWSIDLEDVDKVLRIVANPLLSYADILELMLMHGCMGEELTD